MSVTLNSERGGPPRTAVSIAPDYGAMGSALAALRIFIGIKLLVSGIEKWKGLSHSGLPEKINFWLHTRPPAPILHAVEYGRRRGRF